MNIYPSFLKRLFSEDDNPVLKNSPDTETARQELILRASAFSTLRVADVMTPRTDIIALEAETGLGDVARVFKEASHSRMPVYRESLDNPVGMIHIKDIIAFLVPEHRETSLSEDAFAQKILEEIKHPLLYVPASMHAFDLLVRMQARRLHMALVVDEFGGTDGLVTLEDLLEQLVGNIEDEHDEDETPSLIKRAPHLWEADARVSIEDFKNHTGIDMTEDAEDKDIDTLGGLVFTLAGRVPERGEVIHHPDGYEFEVLDADPRRIKRLHIHAVTPSSDDENT